MYGQNMYGQNMYGQNMHGQNMYGQNMYGQNYYGQNTNSGVIQKNQNDNYYCSVEKKKKVVCVENKTIILDLHQVNLFDQVIHLYFQITNTQINVTNGCMYILCFSKFYFIFE